MINKRFWLGMLVIVLVFGMAVIGCDDGSGNGTENPGGNGTNVSALNGTWVSGPIELKLNNGTFEQMLNGTLDGKGTYNVNGNIISFLSERGFSSKAEYFPNENKLVFFEPSTITYTRE